MTNLPLSDIRVLDFAIARAGPVAVRQLADWGADVIRIEPIGGDTSTAHLGSGRMNSDFQNLHRNKRCLTLNLKHPESRAVVMNLASKVDVVVENFRPDVKHRLGIDYETFSNLNPRIIYGSISGFGQDGPYRERPALDQVVQGMSGAMSVTGLPGQGPVRAGFAVSDYLAGVSLAQGILLALYERERSGKGQWVQASLLESLVAAMDFQAARYLVEGEVPEQVGNDHPTAAPMGLFPASDGLVNIGASQSSKFKALCEAINAPELAQRPEYLRGKSRRQNRVALTEELSAKTRNFTRADLIEKLNALGVTCGPVYDIGEMFNDPQVKHQELAWPYRHKTLGERNLVGQPMRLTRTPHHGVRRPPPEVGEHNDEILTELGLSTERITELKEKGVV